MGNACCCAPTKDGNLVDRRRSTVPLEMTLRLHGSGQLIEARGNETAGGLLQRLAPLLVPAMACREHLEGLQLVYKERVVPHQTTLGEAGIVAVRIIGLALVRGV